MSITPAPVAAAVTALQSAIDAAGTLQGASDAILAPIVQAAIAAQQVIQTNITLTDALIGDGSGLAAGTPAPIAVAYLNAQIAASRAQHNLLWMLGYIARIELNIASRL